MSNNFKVKCVDNSKVSKAYTKGKVYEVKKGVLVKDSGSEILQIKDFKDFCDRSDAIWELVSEEKDVIEEFYENHKKILEAKGSQEIIDRAKCLELAKECVCTSRQEDYGDVEDNFKMIAKLWGVYLGYEIDSKDVAAMMILLKCARVSTGHGKADNWVDVAGYAACGCEIESVIKEKSKEA